MRIHVPNQLLESIFILYSNYFFMMNLIFNEFEIKTYVIKY